MESEGEPFLGIEADIEGEPLPPQMHRWVASLAPPLMDIITTLASHGHGVWLVGGAVRDAWLDQTANVPDIDLATTCEPQETLRLFGENAIATGVEFGTVTVKAGDHQYEVTTLRTESLYRDGRRPDHVAWGQSLREDLSRRDFTFNSMAVDPLRGLFYDPFHGVKDLQERTVRAVGLAEERCQEDALRMLRAYRFLSRDDEGVWTMEASLHDAVKRLASRLKVVAIERIWVELRKILANKHTGAVLGRMKADGVFETILPSCIGIDDAVFHALDDVSLTALTAEQSFAVLMFERPTKTLIQQMQHLRTSKDFQRKAAVFHESLQHLPSTDNPSLRVFDHVLGAGAGAHLAVRTVLEKVQICGTNSTPSAQQVQVAWSNLPSRNSPEHCLVDGHWLMQRTGIAQGIRLGRLKQWLHRLQIEQDLTTTNEMESVLSRLAFEHGEHESWPRLAFP